MKEPIEKTPSLEDKTIRIAEASGFEELINEVSQKHNLADFESRFKIPLPIEKVEREEERFETSPEISENIEVLLEMINEKETAVEYPFLLTGNLKNIDNIDFLYEKFQDLKSTDVEMNPK